MSYLSLGLMATLWCTFAASAGSTLRSGAAQKAFAESLRPLPFVPAGLVHRAAAATTVAETGVVLGLGVAVAAVVGGWSPARPLAVVMLALIGGLLAVFTVGVALAIRRDIGALLLVHLDDLVDLFTPRPVRGSP